MRCRVSHDKPLKINAASLEVRDKEKVATFSGDVHLVQGDTTLRSKTLVVFYDDDGQAKPANPPAAGGALPSQQIRRVEAKASSSSRRTRPRPAIAACSICGPIR
jgi:lipopolysaccharide export system protein LptA